MKIGIVGLTGVGKTTLFNLLTGSISEKGSQNKLEATIGMAKVPDGRIDFLSKLYKPKKITYPTIEFADIVGLVRGASEGAGFGNQFLNSIRNVDLIVHVIRAFENDDVPHVDGEINPLRDYNTVNFELLLADMALVEKRIDKIKNSPKKPKANELEELEILEKLLTGLESEIPIAKMDLGEEERELIKNYNFLSEKPQIIVVNLDEEQIKAEEFDGSTELKKSTDSPIITLSAQIEGELRDLPEEDRVVFMEDLGIKEPGIKKLALSAYRKLGFISFFTVGEDEVKGWSIKEGLNAKEAAGKIHSDIERGFIRAEVFHYNNVYNLGTVQKVREAGLFRLEGKDYKVIDGDIVHFRFNV